MHDPLSHPTVADLLGALPRNATSDVARVHRAYQIAERAHHDQRRDEGSPYIEHPLRVALIVASELQRAEADLICAALLHDVVEDSPVTLAEIQETCGDTVAHFVELLTKEKLDDPDAKRLATRAYLQRIAVDSEEVLLLKLADRLDNLRSVAVIPDWEKRRKYLLETYWQYLPMAQRGGEFFYEQYKQLLADYMREHCTELRLNVGDFPELLGGVETRRHT
ncbi:MAG: HD domain-containing protein [Chloroflexota bacterium]